MVPPQDPFYLNNIGEMRRNFPQYLQYPLVIIRHTELLFEADVKALKTQLMKTKLRGISLEISCLDSDPGYIYWGKKI